jgi:hypothetical protein
MKTDIEVLDDAIALIEADGGPASMRSCYRCMPKA